MCVFYCLSCFSESTFTQCSVQVHLACSLKNILWQLAQWFSFLPSITLFQNPSVCLCVSLCEEQFKVKNVRTSVESEVNFNIYAGIDSKTSENYVTISFSYQMFSEKCISHLSTVNYWTFEFFLFWKPTYFSSRLKNIFFNSTAILLVLKMMLLLSLKLLNSEKYLNWDVVCS